MGLTVNAGISIWNEECSGLSSLEMQSPALTASPIKGCSRFAMNASISSHNTHFARSAISMTVSSKRIGFENHQNLKLIFENNTLKAKKMNTHPVPPKCIKR